MLTLGALVSFAGAVLALWLVREREIEREGEAPQGQAGTPQLVAAGSEGR